MKLALVSLTTITCATTATAFVVAPSLLTTATSTALFSDKKDAETKEEEGGLDLDLGEMFDMFDAADKGEDFDKAIKKVKKESK